MHRWMKEAVLGASVLAALAAPAAAQAPACTIPATGPSVTLPLVTLDGQAIETDPIQNAYRVNISVGGMPAHPVEVDTGSTGIVVPWSAVPSALWEAAAGNTTHLLYTSDGDYLHGRNIQSTVALGVPKTVLTASTAQSYPTTGTIDLMAADCGCKLDTATPAEGISAGVAKAPPTAGGPDCAALNGTHSDPKNTNSPLLKNCTPVGSGMGMMGVGYDRSGRSSNLNTFLRLAAMDSGTMHPGYVITQSNIQLGLNGTNTSGFAFTQLKPSPALAPSKYVKEWKEPPVTIAFPTASPSPASLTGSLLLDTGIVEMLLTVPTADRPTNLVVSGESIKVTGDIVPQKTAFTVTVMNTANTQILTYNATMGGAAPSPTYGSWRGASGTANDFNLGRHALAAANYAYDAQCGQLGFQAVAVRN